MSKVVHKYFKKGKIHLQIEAATTLCNLEYFKVFDATWNKEKVTCKKCLKRMGRE